MNINVLSLSVAGTLLLVGCGGGSSTPVSEGMVLTGVFVDSAVEGATYATLTQSGTTNAEGEFSYLAGEQVTFSIGNAQLPAVAAASQITPVDIAASSATPAAMTTNIARLLQSLDQDGNPDNGITISADAAVSASQLNFDVSVEEFENNAEVINLVANSGSVNTSLISAEEANSHLNSTLGNDATSNVVDTWDITYREDCVEKFTFNADGTFNSIDLEEIQSGTYSLSDEPVANNRYSMEFTVLTDNQLPSCDGETDSSAGNVLSFFAEIESNVIRFYSSADAADTIFQMTLGGTEELQSLSKLEYTNLLIGNTADFAAGSKIYYRADGVKFSRRLSGDEFQGTWSLDSNGLICEEIRGGESTYCIANAENYMMTRTPGSNTYNYSETGFVSAVTITSGDTLGLSGS